MTRAELASGIAGYGQVRPEHVVPQIPLNVWYAEIGTFPSCNHTPTVNYVTPAIAIAGVPYLVLIGRSTCVVCIPA
jgi:hypothetical protein